MWLLFGFFDTISKLSMYLPPYLRQIYKKHTSVSLPVIIDAMIPQNFYFYANFYF